MFCDVFSTRGFKCHANTTVFLIFYFQFSKQTSQKHWYQYAKNTMFETIFHNFSAHAPPFKNDHFSSIFATAHPDSRRRESGQIAKLHLNSTFLLSQSLPQSCHTKTRAGCLGQNAVNYGVLWTYHALYLQKRYHPQLKLTCVSASGKTRPFAPTGVGGFGDLFQMSFFQWFVWIFLSLEP